MEKEQSRTTEKILNLTLEIVFLLTGENYIAFKLSDGLVASNLKTQSHAFKPYSSSKNKMKVQEITQKMIELLTGEVTAEVNLIDHSIEEETYELYVRGAELCRKENTLPEISTYPEDNRAFQGDVKAEEEDEGDLRIKVEEIPPEISGEPLSNNTEFPFIAQDGTKDCNESKSEENTMARGVHLLLPRPDQSSDPNSRRICFPDLSPSITHQTDCNADEAFSSADHGDCYSQRNDISSHSIFHTEENSFSCSQCGKCFTRKAYLVKHERIHSGLTPFSCSECGKCFTRRTSLMSHQRTHTGVKPYSCPECGKCFTWRTSFIEHQRSHTGVKPYTCPVCGKCFSLYSAFSKHQKIHTGEKPYSCAECGKHFTRSDHLLIHRRTHTGEKPFSCAECGKGFNERARLISHQVVHTGIHPYSCSVCGRGFTTNSRLLKHQQVHLSLEPHAWAQ